MSKTTPGKAIETCTDFRRFYQVKTIKVIRFYSNFIKSYLGDLIAPIFPYQVVTEQTYVSAMLHFGPYLILWVTFSPCSSQNKTKTIKALVFQLKVLTVTVLLKTVQKFSKTPQNRPYTTKGNGISGLNP